MKANEKKSQKMRDCNTQKSEIKQNDERGRGYGNIVGFIDDKQK
jgi:hypothetical protein